MDQTITINQHITFSEYYFSSVYYFLTRKKVILYVVGLSGVAFIGQLLGPIISGKPLTFMRLIPVFAVVIFVPAFVLLSTLVLGLLMRRTRPMMFENVVYTINDWGITREGKETGFAKPWREITKVRETKNYFLVESVGDAHALMKRCFSSNEDIIAFRNLIKQNVRKPS